MSQSAESISQQDIDPAEWPSWCETVAQRSRYLPIKRSLDIAVSALMLLALSPLMLVVALLVRLGSPGPIFYRAKRYGLNGQPFMMLKFRSMRVLAPADEAAFRASLKANGILAKVDNDPRVTPIGRWIRRTSVDETPQLFNVLWGDMSLIGPRPVVPEMLHLYPQFDRTRSLVRPGLSGLWQVRDRSNATHVAFMWHHDLEYLRQLSLKLDLKILLHTLVVTLQRKGAR